MMRKTIRLKTNEAIKRFPLIIVTGLFCLSVCMVNASGIEVLKVSEVDPNGLTFATGSQTKFSTNINGRTFQKQNALTTFNGWQYTTYYDADRNIVLGRRHLPDGNWELIRFSDYKITSSDAHNITSVGICHGDGTIHLAFDHHAYDLNYRVSQKGVATNPESVEWNASLFGPVTDQLGSVGKLTRFTYPRFINSPNGNLMLYYRFGGSGNGQGVIQEYDATMHDWTSNLGIFIGNTGTYSGVVTANSTSRNPYLNGIFYCGERLHVSWGWRETSSASSNHDICYAYSDDNGRTWFNNAGTQIGETGKSKITVNSPGSVVAEIPQGQGLSNQYTSYFYQDGRAHVIVVHNGFYEHHFRTVDGAWDFEVLPFAGSRPDIAGDVEGNLYLIYSSSSSLNIAKGVKKESGTGWDWSVVYTRSDATEMGEGIYDRARWESENILSVYGQETPPQQLDYGSGPMIDGMPAPVHVIDFHVSPEAVSPSPQSGASDVPLGAILEWTSGQGAVAQHLYFGTDSEEVEMAGLGSFQYLGEFPGLQFVPNGLVAGQTYFWRIDQEQLDGTIVKGNVWSFETTTERMESYWAGFLVSATGDVNTGAWMQYLNVTFHPYIWSYTFSNWTYIKESAVSSNGGWMYLFNF